MNKRRGQLGATVIYLGVDYGGKDSMVDWEAALFFSSSSDSW